MFQSQSMMKSDAFRVARCWATEISIVPEPQNPRFSTLQTQVPHSQRPTHVVRGSEGPQTHDSLEDKIQVCSGQGSN